MKPRDEGSVFIESMVAAAIVALALVAMYRTVEESALHNRMIDEKRTALLIAQSHLASVGSVVPIVQGTTGGTDGPYAWSVQIAPDDNNTDASDAGNLWQVTVAVRAANGGGLVTLRSLALAPAG